MSFSLLPCDATGTPAPPLARMPDALTANCQGTAALYQRVGFVPPWIGYVAVVDGRGVGGGAFVGPPQEGVVEIAYYTLDDEQGRGYGTQTAAALVALARAHTPGIALKAYTLMEENASTRILHRLGFTRVGVAHDADAGDVWEWRA